MSLSGLTTDRWHNTPRPKSRILSNHSRHKLQSAKALPKHLEVDTRSGKKQPRDSERQYNRPGYMEIISISLEESESDSDSKPRFGMVVSLNSGRNPVLCRLSYLNSVPSSNFCLYQSSFSSDSYTLFL